MIYENIFFHISMHDTLSLAHTGLENILDTSKNPAVAHKLGGDNMALLAANAEVLRILAGHGVTQTMAVSAFRSSSADFNTTSKLIEAGISQDMKNISEILQEIEVFHSDLLADILRESPWALQQELIWYTRNLFGEYQEQLKNTSLEACLESTDYQVWVGEKVFSLLSLGEVIAAKVLVKYLQSQDIPAVYIDIAHEKDIAASELPGKIKLLLQEKFGDIWKQNPLALPIVPGYIWGIQGGILKRLGRGYTDFTGERCAVALHELWNFDEVIFYIQKMYGFKSTDPRVLREKSEAKSVNALNYELTRRAISHRGAGAGLINLYALSEDIQKSNIPLYVGNPTDMSDIAIIDTLWDPQAEGVQLVLGRNYSEEYDGRTYGIRNPDEGRHIVYLMGQNITNSNTVFQEAVQLLEAAGLREIAGEIIGADPREVSLVFENKETAQKAQQLLHSHFIG